MNTDYTKPSLAPKPRFVCHSGLRLPSSLTSTAKGLKPFVAPKPKINSLLNGNQGELSNGGVNNLNEKIYVDTNIENEEKAKFDTLLDEIQFETSICKLPERDLQPVKKQQNGRVTEKENEEDSKQKMDANWRLTDSVLTMESVSLETFWVRDGRRTPDSMEIEKMIGTDLTKDMDAAGCDAGESLADTDGLSVGNISACSTDEDTCCFIADSCDAKQDEKEGSTADDLSESPTDKPRLLDKHSTNTTEAKHSYLTEEELEESGLDCGFSSITMKWGQMLKKKGESWQEVCFYNNNPGSEEQVCDASKEPVASEGPCVHEPLYICSEDIIDQSLRPINTMAAMGFYPVKKSESMRKKYEERKENELTIYSRGNDSVYKNAEKRSQNPERENEADKHEGVLIDLDGQLRCRQVTISEDTSLTSSLSESQLLSPNDSDVFQDEDLDGHVVPYLDDTTDTEQEISDEHVYEEPRPANNIFPFHRKTSGIRSHSVSHRITNHAEDLGVQFLQKTYVSGFGQPALSSSPMLNSARYKSYSKPYYLSLYPRSLSVEGKETHMCACRDGSQKHRDLVQSSESFSRGSSSALFTPTSLVDIPPPFELAYITKKPITKSSPSLFTEGDSSEKNKKKKSSLKRFLMLKFKWKTDKPVDVKLPSSKSSAEYSHRTSSRFVDLDRHSISASPRLNCRSAKRPEDSPEPTPTFLFYEECKRKGNSVAFLNRGVVRVESFEDRSRVPFLPLPLTKPRSISFPNTDTSDYENVPAISSDYENVQVPQRRPIRQVPRIDFFDRPGRVLSAANETDGYVDMSSLPGFEKKTQSPEQETESAYTEAYNVCAVAMGAHTALKSDEQVDVTTEEDHGCTSEEEEKTTDANYDRLPDGRSRAFYIVKELVETERVHVKALKLLQEDFREAVCSAVDDEGQPVLDDERLREILNELPDVYSLHRKILTELENRIRHWEDSQNIADIFLSRKAEFLVFTTYIGHYDRSMSLLEDSCETSPSFLSVVKKFEDHCPTGKKVSLKHQLLHVIVRVAQYRMLLMDYLNNLSPDSKEYEDTQAAVAIVSDIADQINDSLKHGKNLLRLINIAYSVRGQQDLLHPDRVFVKEGNLMKVSRKSHQPRHLFLMNDVLLYTYPQQDGKYRLKNTLPLSGLKVSKPIIENALNALKIEGKDISIILSASSFLEREDWYYTLNRAVTEHMRGSAALNSCSGEARDGFRLCLGEKAPTLVPVSQVTMCMNCSADFSLTLRRHHCHGCGRIVCRSCSKNRYALKYMKGRMAKVCDYCYSELKKRGGDLDVLLGKDSPRQNRSGRPLSTVFQNIHPPNIWRHKKGTMSFTQVTVSDEGSISGNLHRSKKNKRNWKRLWFLLKDKVLYTYRAQEEKVASESLPLLGFTVKLPDAHGRDDETNVFQLYHKNTLYYSFKAEDNFTAQRWVNAMEEATNL